MPPSVLPDISPTGGEIRLSSTVSSISSSAEEGPTSPPLISPPVGEMSGRTEGGNVGRKRP
ncbi:hypothetical protein G6N74_12920 [Mesorhizobium sp. CGMCC 1.15528]|uniref:Propionyl-coenzyme A carboxylase alpha polypeptide n=1 Tax=Mesorhizobium zhangyense TaxID=1776730 RepID=A0A7C9VBZ7_9HYPH|nr:hypothetical protein [Mesorhizobium zhangyense]